MLLAIVFAIPRGAVAQTGSANHTVAAGSHLQSFFFGKEGDIERASLLLLPITFQSRLSSRMALDGYAAYASGSISGNAKRYTLSGPVDSWVRLRWAANSRTVLAVGFALPTGVASHTGIEAAVSNALANDLLGFREAAWGGAASGTFGLSTVHHTGATKITFGGSYRMAGTFQPSVDTTMRYAPGDEARFRAGVERKVGAGTFSGGATVQHFSVDKADNRNLFQSGNRLRGDLSYTTASWSAYAANLWRQKGDLTIPIINSLDGSRLRDTVVAVGWQNLVIAGASRTVRVRQNLIFVPNLDVKVRTRQDARGDGWLMSSGVVMPLLAGGNELFPNVRVSYGSIYSTSRPTFAQKTLGLELGLVVRRAFLRQ